MFAPRIQLMLQRIPVLTMVGEPTRSGRSINIFLLEGEPDGTRVAQISMSTIQAIAFRKVLLRETRSTFPELTRTGVYLLLGFDETQPDKQVAYIGESESVAGRLQYHAGNDKGSSDKSFWIWTIALVSKDETLTKSHARYVEARLIDEAKRNPSWRLMNTQMATEVGKLPLPDRSAMEEFISQTKTLVGALGCDLFKAPPSSEPSSDSIISTSAPSTVGPVFGLSGQGYNAQMMVTPSGDIILKKGSTARKLTTPTVPTGTVAMRHNLIERGTLLQGDDAFLLKADCMFSSVSAAAAVVTGGSANGRVLWRLPDGRSYADWEAGQNSSAPAEESGPIAVV